MIAIKKIKKIFGKKFTCGDCAYTTPNEEYPDSLVDCRLYKTFYNKSREKCKRFKLSSVKRNCDFCIFETFENLRSDYLRKNHIVGNMRSDPSQKYCSILDEFKCLPLKELCPYHAYKLIELPNPFFHNNHICPYCNKEVKKNDKKGRCRFQAGKKYQWFHVDCRRNHGFKNPMGFDNIKLKLMI